MLIDLSRLTEVAFDPDSGIARAQPGGKGRELNSKLAEHGLFFPTGHCPTVGVGGYLLQGGWGWNSRVLGPACMSVEAVDVVTAEGEPIHANANENSDFWWAARGSGPGSANRSSVGWWRTCRRRGSSARRTFQTLPLSVKPT